MVAIGPAVSEEKSFEIVDGRRTDGRRTDDGRTTEPAYTISSPGAFGSGELKTGTYKIFFNFPKNDLLCSLILQCSDAYKDADGMANTVVPYRTVFLGAV